MFNVKWVVLSAVLAIGIGSVLAQDYPCDVYLRSAKIYLNRSTPDYESALKNLKDGYQKCYNDPVLHELLGRIYADQNQLEKMAEEFRIAKQLGHPKAADMDSVLQSKWIQSFQNGTQTLEQADAAASDSLRSILFEQAAKSFETCIMMDSSRYQPYVNAAAQWISLNRTERADTLLANAYQLAPESLNVVLSYGINLYNLENYDRAIQIFEKAIKIDANNREALINLASLYGQKMDTDSNALSKAMLIWEDLIEKQMANKDIYYNRGSIFFKKAEKETIVKDREQLFKSAEKDFEKVVELDSNDVDALYQLALVQLNMNEIDKAQVNLEKVVTLEPSHKSAWETLAIIYTKKGMKDKAKEADARSKGEMSDSK